MTITVKVVINADGQVCVFLSTNNMHGYEICGCIVYNSEVSMFVAIHEGVFIGVSSLSRN